jgi:hypothetical protein
MQAATIENGRWTPTEIESGLKPLQDAVKGLIELIPVPSDDKDLLSLFGNDEARLIDMPPTAIRVDMDGNVWDVLHGPLIALGGADDEGDCTSLTPEGFDLLRLTIWPITMTEVVPGVMACMASKPHDHPAKEVNWPEDWPFGPEPTEIE